MEAMPNLFPFFLVFCMPLMVFAESLNFNRDVRPILSENLLLPYLILKFTKKFSRLFFVLFCLPLLVTANPYSELLCIKM